MTKRIGFSFPSLAELLKVIFHFNEFCLYPDWFLLFLCCLSKYHQKIKSNLHHTRGITNEWRGPSPRQSAGTTQKRRSCGDSASDLTSPRIEAQISRTDCVRLGLATKLISRQPEIIIKILFSWEEVRSRREITTEELILSTNILSF